MEVIKQQSQEEREDTALLRAAGELAITFGLWDGMVPVGGIPKPMFTYWLRQIERVHAPLRAGETRLSRAVKLARGGEAPPLPFGSASPQKDNS